MRNEPRHARPVNGIGYARIRAFIERNSGLERSDRRSFVERRGFSDDDIHWRSNYYTMRNVTYSSHDRPRFQEVILFLDQTGWEFIPQVGEVLEMKFNFPDGSGIQFTGEIRKVNGNEVTVLPVGENSVYTPPLFEEDPDDEP